MISLEDTLKIQEYRRKAQDGSLTLEECREALIVLRQGREGAQIGSTKSRTAKAEAKKPIDTAALLAGLKGMQKP